MSNPVPTLVKHLRGTDQPCRIQPNEPQPADAITAVPPAFLSETQKRLWVETLAAAPVELVRALDWAIYTQYVIATDLYIQAATEVNRSGYEVRGYRGAKLLAPAVALMNSQAQIMRQCLQELGFTPAARTRINSQAGLEDSGSTAAADHWAQLDMDYQQ